MRIQRLAFAFASLLLVNATLAGCGNGDSVSSDEQARRAYLGLDKSIAAQYRDWLVAALIPALAAAVALTAWIHA